VRYTERALRGVAGRTGSFLVMHPMQSILEMLEQDAHISPAQIASRLNLDEETVRAQIAKWESNGIIRRYKAVVDHQRLGDERVEAFIDVSVTPERGAGFDDIAARIARFSEVRSVALVSGGHDLRIVAVGADMKEIANFVAQKLATLDRVTSTNTHFVLKRYKEDGDLFVEGDADHRLLVAP